MRLIVDSNIVFSIIVSGKKSKAFRLLTRYDFELFIPEEILFEFRKHAQKLKKNREEFEHRTLLAFSLLHLIPKEFYKDKIREAYEIAKCFDKSDTPFIALAMKLKIPLWTGDKDMIEYSFKSGLYTALDTKAIEELLEGRTLNQVIANLRNRIYI